MDITWLGQAGLLFENGSIKILIDPYLSDSVKQINPLNYRRVAVDESFFDIKPDIIVCTHDHLDHLDPDTLKVYLQREEKAITVLAPNGAWQKLRGFSSKHNYVLFNPLTSITLESIRFTAICAEHSDPYAIGVLIEDEDKTYYITGDTLYNERIFTNLPTNIDAVFLPINGVGNNMNMKDAARFAMRVGAKNIVPLHYGMFDDINPNLFDVSHKVIPTIYKKIQIK